MQKRETFKYISDLLTYMETIITRIKAKNGEIILKGKFIKNERD